MIRTFMRHSNHRLLRFAVPVGGLFFIVGAFALLNSSVLFTYRSRANEEVFNTMEKQQHSVESVEIHDQLPLCVTSLSYVPISEKSLQSCFVQFRCIDPVDDVDYFTTPHYSCTIQDQGFICAENESQKECGYIDDWIKGAANTCGCPDELLN